VPLSQTGAELLFEIFSQRHERGSTIVTSNLPFDEWTSVFGNQRLTGALLDHLTHHVHILELNGESYRLKQSKARRRREAQPADLAARNHHRVLKATSAPAAKPRPSSPGRTRRVALYDSENGPGFTPPHWTAFTPPLTGWIEAAIVCVAEACRNLRKLMLKV
jgi:IstB-like ATP binding protein